MKTVTLLIAVLFIGCSSDGYLSPDDQCFKLCGGFVDMYIDNAFVCSCPSEPTQVAIEED